MSSSLSSTTSPLIPQAASPGQLVGLVLQNTSGVSTAASEVSFGQVFKAGAVSPGAQLYATVTGADGGVSEVAVQMDAKTFNADGSVATSVLSFLAPAIAANSSSGVMLSVGPALANAAPLDLASALKNYSLTVDLAVQTGTAAAPATTNVHIDAVAAMQAALANGTASFWQSGPNASQARVIVPVTGSMQMVFDITANANGTFATDVQFDNDEAWVQNSSGKLVTGTAATDQGGTVTYNETITQNGSVVSQQSNVTQYQYQNWHKVVTTQPSLAQINIQHDVAYLEATGAVQNYDLTTGIPAGDIAGYVQTMASAPNSATTSALGSGYGQPLAANGVDPGMNGTGSRPDIGPTTNVNSDWLMTQNATVAQYALGEADAAGAVPWNMQNGTTGLPLTTLTDVNLWTDPRGGPYSGSSGLVQNPNNGNNWEVDTSHQPDLSYDPYILTGSRYNFDELQQQAAYSVTSQWPAWQQRSRNAVSDLIVNGNQVRGAAWELRQVDEAAATALPGSAMQSYFTGVENDNFAWLVSQEAGWTAQQGQAYGWLPGVYGNNGNYGPWEQDFLSIVVAQAAEQGNALAKQFMAWEDNFIVGRFLQAQNGFLPADGIAYTLQFYDPKTGLDYQTWAQIEQVTASYGLSNGPNPNATGWAHSQGYYGQLALASLAGVITVFGSDTAQGHQAIQAYGWLLASGAPFINMPTSGQYSIVPRLADGNLLTRNDLLIGTDAAGTTNTLSLATQTPDQLITAGAGNDTLKGGTGINILFGGSGNDQLIGGPGNDLLYGGSGATTLYAAAGTNYLQAGTGPDTFILNPNDQATDAIQGFKIGADQLAIVGGNASIYASLIAGATSDASGNAVLTLAPGHVVTLDGISIGSLTASMFEVGVIPVAPVTSPAVPPSTSPGTIAGGSNNNGGSSSAGPSSVDTVSNAPPPPTSFVSFANAALGANAVTIDGVGLSFSGDGKLVQGNLFGKYAAPFISNDNGALFGASANAQDTQPYLSTGFGSVTMALPGEEQYFGLLWGSVDKFNALSFYNGGTLVGTLSGSDIMTNPNGNESVSGSVYININSATPFNKVVASSPSPSFEFSNLSFNQSQQVLAQPKQNAAQSLSFDSSANSPANPVVYVQVGQLATGNAAASLDGVGFSFSGAGAVVSGNLTDKYAAPFVSNDNGALFGVAANEQDTQSYLSTGNGSVTMTLPSEAHYFGLLWGSVDTTNSLSLYNGNTLVETVSGSQISATPNGSLGANGSEYVNINSAAAFDKVVASNTQPSFEFSNIAFAASEQATTGISVVAPPAGNPKPVTPVVMTAPTIGSGPDTLNLGISQDYYQGSAQFTIDVNGQQIGGIQTVDPSVLNGAAGIENYIVQGSFGAGPSAVSVSFINDAYGGSPSLDRNLYVKSISLDGSAPSNEAAALMQSAIATFLIPGIAPPVALAGPSIGSGPDTLTLGISQDYYQGSAQFTVDVNGQQIGGVQAVDPSVLNWAGGIETYTLQGDFSSASGADTVSVNFLNDAYGGSPSLDRNLYVTSVSLDGSTPSTQTAALMQAGTANFNVAAPAPVANILTVGANGEYQTLAAATAAAVSGDTIEVQAGTYTNDFATVSGGTGAGITIEAVGGQVNEVATVAPPNEKALLDESGNVTVNGFAFSGVAISADAGGNGAGIRYEGGNLTLNNDDFHNNQDGVLGNADPNGTITANNSEFADNGSGSGYTHNIYIGDIQQATINNSLFTGANAGHEIKSRAQNTTITNSRIIDGPGGTASYSIDTPNGGNVTIQNNVIEKASTAGNPVMITSGEEGAYGNSSLTVSGNIFINDYGASAVAVRNDAASTASVTGNQFYGMTASQLTQGNATVSGATMLSSAPALDLSAPFSSSQLSVADVTSQSSVIAGALAATSASSTSTASLPGGVMFATQQTSAMVSMLHAA